MGLNNKYYRQIKLAFKLSENELKDLLEERLGKSVNLILTRNSSSMLSFQFKNGVLHVRLHEMFLSADSGVIDEIIGFINSRRRRMPLFRAFIKENSFAIQRSAPRKIKLKTLGRHHDLLEIFNEVNREYFGGSVTAQITWGCGKKGVCVRKRTLGSYSAESNIIRVNPILDSARTPRYYLKYIVFHETLHAHLGAEKRGGRRCVHTAEFKRLERMYRDYERAVMWERGSSR